MSHLQIPIISELDKHYSPRPSIDEPRRTSVGSVHPRSAMSSHLQLPLLTALDQHFTPRSSISQERRPSAAGTQAATSRSQLHLPLISDLDTYYSPHPSMDERRPSVPEVLPKPATHKAAKKQQPSFMDAMQSYPWFSGTH